MRKLLVVFVLLSQAIHAEFLTKILDYPLLEISATQQSEGLSETIKISWDHVNKRLVHIDVVTSAMTTPPVRQEVDRIDYTKIFGTLKAFTDSYSLPPSTPAALTTAEELAKAAKPSQMIIVINHPALKNFQLEADQAMMPASYALGRQLIALMKLELNSQQLKLLAPPQSQTPVTGK